MGNVEVARSGRDGSGRSGRLCRRMRVCLVYDCLFPYTVGGAERWYRNLAQRLAADGHEVTYLTLRQWPRGESGDVPGVRVVAAGPRLALYREAGQRRILPPLVFGAGVLWHLLRHGRGYDVIHTASFPYFSLLAAAVARAVHRFRLIVDWHELWSREYWHEYLGPRAGQVGWWVQALCLRVPQRAFCFANLTAERLRAEAVRGPVTVLEGEYVGALTPAAPRPADPLVVFAGRHIPEKRAPAGRPPGAAAPRRPAGRVRRPPHPGEAGAGGRARGRGGAPDASGPPRADPRRRSRAGRGPRRDRGARARRRRRGARLRLLRGRRDGPGARALHGPAVAPRGLRAGRRRGVRGGHAVRRRRRPGQRRDRAGRGGRQRVRRRVGRCGGPRRRDPARPPRRAGSARVDRRLVRAQRPPAIARFLARPRRRELLRRSRGERALVGRERQPRGAVPRERGGVLAAGDAQPLRQSGIVHQPFQRRSNRRRVGGIEKQRRVARHLQQ